MSVDTQEQLPQPVQHGGSLDEARRRFPSAPEPFIDLSTGINPRPYPIGRLSDDLFVRLPEASATERLNGLAAAIYGAPSSRHIVAAPGTQILLPLIGGKRPAGRAAVLATTYHEHLRALQLAGHDAVEVQTAEELHHFDIAVIVNPNNPDGRLIDKEHLSRIARRMRPGNSLLVVDEAFMDVLPASASMADTVTEENIIVQGNRI